MKFILGKKIEMTQVWRNEVMVPVTKVQTGKCMVLQVKSTAKDGYDAIQVGFGDKKEKNINKPQKGHMKGLGNFRYLREFRLPAGDLKKGDCIDINTFEPKDIVKVVGSSKGKGFQGVVRRHHFHGQDKTHGTKDQVRMPGSIGSTGPQHVFKGVRMAGQMGNGRITTTNLEIIEIDNENEIIYVKGAVPGARNGLIMIIGDGELKIKTLEVAKEETLIDAKEETLIDAKEETPEVAKEETLTDAKEETPVVAKEEVKADEEVKVEEKNKTNDK